MNEAQNAPESKTLANTLSRRDFLAWIFAFAVSTITQSNALAADYEERYVVEGNKRTFTVTGKDLNAVHAIAANGFVKKLEKEILERKLVIKSFDTEIHKKEGGYELKYIARLESATDKNRHTMVDMRGTVWSEKWKAKEWVRRINASKIPLWQKKMQKAFGMVRYMRASYWDESLYTETFLAVGKK